MVQHLRHTRNHHRAADGRSLCISDLDRNQHSLASRPEMMALVRAGELGSV